MVRSLDPSLRDRFDEARAPDVDGLVTTHQRDLYLVTDGSYDSDVSRAGLGAILERDNGERVARLATYRPAPDNNVAEYLALFEGFRLLPAVASPGDRIGVLVDHADLAVNLNRFVRFVHDPACHDPGDERVPPALRRRWRTLRSLIATVADLQTVVIPGADNPAHPLASRPDRYVAVPGVISETASIEPRSISGRTGSSAVNSPADD